MKIEAAPISGLYIITPDVRGDTRGFFMEVYREDEFMSAGINTGKFVQQNHSRSEKGIIRGLHFQWDKPLGKLIRVVNGGAFVVAVDIRKKSKTLGKWFSLELNADNKKIFFVPSGFASGFTVTGDCAEVEYLYTVLYNQNGESNIIWNDPEIGINWPNINNPILSDRDKNAGTFHDWLMRPESDIF